MGKIVAKLDDNTALNAQIPQTGRTSQLRLHTQKTEPQAYSQTNREIQDYSWVGVIG